MIIKTNSVKGKRISVNDFLKIFKKIKSEYDISHAYFYSNYVWLCKDNNRLVMLDKIPPTGISKIKSAAINLGIKCS